MPESEPHASDERHLERARKLFEKFLGLEQGDRVLFVTGRREKPEVLQLIDTFRHALEERGVGTSTIVGDKRTKEPDLLREVGKHQIVWCSWDMDDTEIPFDNVTELVARTRGRFAFCPGLGVENLDDEGSLSEDPDLLDRRLRTMEAKLREMAGFHIRSAYGTDLVVPLIKEPKMRRWFRETGVIEEGAWGNFPQGEIFTTPDETAVNGILVLPTLSDVADDQGVDEFVQLTIYNGVIRKIDGGKSADKLRKYLKKEVEPDEVKRLKREWKTRGIHVRKGSKEETEIQSQAFENVHRIAEIGFGANAKARSIVRNPEGQYDEPGNPVVEAEKRLGTFHLAIGSSGHGEEGTEGFNREVDAHLDFIIPRSGLTVTGYRSRSDLESRTNGERLISDGGWNFV